jgi:hypothetical protein
MRTRLLAALSALAALVALAWARVARGTAVVTRRTSGLTLLGRNRPSNGTFRVEVARLSVALPVRERRPR